MSVESLIKTLEQKKLHLAIAESLTGGALSAELISVAGASKVVLGSIVAYQTELKHELLGVSKALLQNQGAVDAEVAAQMAAGVRTKLAAKTGLDEALVIGVSTTGVAGPDAQDGKPVGTVFIGLSGTFGEWVIAEEFTGDRAEIRAKTVAAALNALSEQLA